MLGLGVQLGQCLAPVIAEVHAGGLLPLFCFDVSHCMLTVPRILGAPRPSTSIADGALPQLWMVVYDNLWDQTPQPDAMDMKGKSALNRMGRPGACCSVG